MFDQGVQNAIYLVCYMKFPKIQGVQVQSSAKLGETWPDNSEFSEM